MPFYSNGTGFIANKRQQLFIYDELTKKLDLIVDPDFNVGKVVVSKDLKHVYYTGKQAKSIKSLTTHIYVYHMESKNHRYFCIMKIILQSVNYLS